MHSTAIRVYAQARYALRLHMFTDLLYNGFQITQAIEIVGLNPDDKKHVGKYSLGMKQRLGLAQAIMENPDILKVVILWI